MTASENLRLQLYSILDQKSLQVVFQPIICLKTQSIYGYEGLVRGPSNTLLHSPVLLFETASQLGKLMELDLLCREMVIRRFRNLDLPGRLFINVDPVSMLHNGHLDGRTMELIESSALDPSMVIIEVTETRPIDDIELMLKAVAHYRDMGFRVALDDLGAGYSGLKLWSEIRPDFVKIDRHFIQNVDKDRTKQQFIRSIISTASSLGCSVVTEGVESEGEYAALRKLGLSYVQGYYFSRPQDIPPRRLSPRLFRKEQIRPMPVNENATVEILAQPAVSVQAMTSVMEVGEIFMNMLEVESLVVVTGHEVLGLIIRREFMNVYASRYGKELHGKKTIFRFLNRRVPKVEKHQTLEDVSYQLTSSLNTYTEEFIVLDNTRLLGKARLIDLLQAITELKVNRARYANPLTLLPGNVPIQRHLKQLFEGTNPFTICYFDLDNFKPFNDVYGFTRGDEILLFVAQLLREQMAGEECFIGHIGGDDFVLITASTQWQNSVARILERFDTDISRFYPDDAQQITALDRNGKQRIFNRMTLSVGAVSVLNPEKSKECDLGEEAAIAKHLAKTVPRSSLHVRRIGARQSAPGAGMAAALILFLNLK